MRGPTNPAQVIVRGTLILGVVVVFAYVLWLSNDSNRSVLKTLSDTSSHVRYGQFKQQEMMNRIEYRLARTSMQYNELLKKYGADAPDKIAEAMDMHTPYQSSLQKAGEALKLSDVQSAMDSLTETNHHLLDRLKVVQEKASGNSTAHRKILASLNAEAARQEQLTSKITKAESEIHSIVTQLESKFPKKVTGIISQLTETDHNLLSVSDDLHQISELVHSEKQKLMHYYETIVRLALEQRFGDDPPKVGTTLCFSLIMQGDIDKGQAQIVSRLYRTMCDKYVQFGEGQLLVPVEDSQHPQPYILGEHVIPLSLSQASGHAENWEKLNTAISYIHEHFFDYDFYLKVDPDTYFFSGNYQYFMAYMSRKWGERFVNEPLYAGLPLHHNAPSYNSGHVYILNRKSLALIHSVLSESRKAAKGFTDWQTYELQCEWDEPVKDKFLPGCAYGCFNSPSLDVAKAFCEVMADCNGIVDKGPHNPKRYELRASTTMEDSATGEAAIIPHDCPTTDGPPKFTAECMYALRTPEDLQLGHCFYSLGVRTWDTRDNMGREFLSFTDPKTWSQGFPTVMTVPWYYRARYFDNYGALSKHLADHIVSIHVGYDYTLLKCWIQIYDAICALEPGSDYGRKTLTTQVSIGEWFDHHRYELLGTPTCPDSHRLLL